MTEPRRLDIDLLIFCITITSHFHRKRRYDVIKKLFKLKNSLFPDYVLIFSIDMYCFLASYLEIWVCSKKFSIMLRLKKHYNSLMGSAAHRISHAENSAHIDDKKGRLTVFSTFPEPKNPEKKISCILRS